MINVELIAVSDLLWECNAPLLLKGLEAVHMPQPGAVLYTEGRTIVVRV